MRRDLAATQRWFFGQLQPGAHRSPGPVKGSRRLSAEARVTVYADMYLARLVEALAAEFPRLATALGEGAFAALAIAYFRVCPSTHPTIQHVGLELPGYLSRRPLRIAPYAADLARLDQATSEVYVAQGIGEEPLVSRDELRRVPQAAWPTLRFRVTPTFRVLRFGWAFPRGGPPAQRTTTLRIWRKGLDVFEAEVAADERRALNALRSGKSFAEVCVAAGTAERAATLLATWVEEGLLLALVP